MANGNGNSNHRDLKPKKTATLIAHKIVGEIVDSSMPPGTLLPPERDMLVEYGVGRGSLREALRLLELQNVLSIKPGRGGGPVVMAPDASHLASTLALLLHIARTPFRSIVEARRVLEPVMAAKSAERIDADQLTLLGRSVEQMGAHIHDAKFFVAENARFHDAIAWTSGNEVFGYLLTSLHGITDGTVLGIEYDEPSRRVVHRAHERIYRAIGAGDTQAAHHAMERHMADFAYFLEKYYPSVMDRPVRWEQITG